MARIEDYALIGDLQTAALVGARRLDRLVLLPPLRLGRVLRRASRDARTAAGSSPPIAPVARSTRRYRDDTLVLETLHETDDGVVRVIDFMPPRGEAPDIVRIVEGVEGAGADALGAVIRFDYGQHRPVGAAASTTRASRSPGRTRSASARRSRCTART